MDDNSPPDNGQITPELRSVPRRLVQSTLFPQKPQPQGREEEEDDHSPPENGRITPELRSVRRRLVQSTLFPQKLQPQGREEDDRGQAEVDRVGEEGEIGGGEEVDCGGSGGKRKIKPRANTTPQKKSTPRKKSSEKPPRGKRSSNTTPKKNLANLLNEEAPFVTPDLGLEPKLSAEDNPQLSAGMPLHPFFSSYMSSKKNRLEGQQFASGRAKKKTNCAPIHVFEKTQHDAVPLDWKSWKFQENIFRERNFFLEPACSSSAGGSVECLSFEKFPITLHPCDELIAKDDTPLQQCPIQEECPYETTPISEDNSKFCHQPLKDAEEKKANRVDFFTCHTGGVWNPYIGEESKFLEERMRSYYHCCSSYPSDNLWTYKYQPRKAMEVCGNDESVKFLSEWLQHWWGRDLRLTRDNGFDMDCKEDNDCVCSESDSDAENKHEGGIKNVLLVTGPVGSGKTAAIYACAHEQGYKVLEVSASDRRNGALVKQRFGEALESQQLKRSLASSVCSPNKRIAISSALANGSASQESDGAVVELVPSSDDGLHNETAGSGFSNCKEAGSFCHESEYKALLLFEDVDITFPEDRGLIAAIQQISETAKGPIILTSNSHDPLLPANFDRMLIHFAAPSSEDLMSHVQMICTAESIDIKPRLLEQLLGSCEGDIRKLITHLQFWCHGISPRKARKMQRSYGSVLFDLEAGHRILPKLIPWDLPSQLAELVHKEIAESISRQDPSLMEVIQEEPNTQEANHAFMNDNETEIIEAKKMAMLSMNFCNNECEEFKPELKTEVSDDTDTPFSCFRQYGRKLHHTVLSSDSEDELADNGCTICPDRGTNNETPLEETPSLKDRSCFSDPIEKCYHCPETESFVPVADDKTLDLSCVPESSFVPETVISNGAGLEFGMVSGNYFDEEVSMGNGLLVEVNSMDVSKATMEDSSSNLLYNQHEALEICHQEEVEDSHNEHAEAISIKYQWMDESSRVDHKRLTKYVEKPKRLAVSDVTQTSWNKLRGRRADLSEYVRLEKQCGLEIANLTHGMSDLLSDTDILLTHFHLLTDDSEEPSFIHHEESYSFHDKRLFACTTAEHGFCYYAKNLAAIGSTLGSKSTVDLASEMTASSTGRMSLGKIAQQDKSEYKSTLFDALHSIVPPKSYSTLKGPAFYEYMSSLRSISRSEASRLSPQSNENPRRRRKRASRHYLSTGLSLKEISSLGQDSLRIENSCQSGESN